MGCMDDLWRSSHDSPPEEVVMLDSHHLEYGSEYDSMALVVVCESYRVGSGLQRL